jgi:Ca2+-binding RTX toxin-like protein
MEIIKNGPDEVDSSQAFIEEGRLVGNTRTAINRITGQFSIASEGNYLFGVGGNDTLYSFGGYDEIYGGAGADTFAFRAADLPGAFSTIRDYSAVEGDGIVFEGVAAGSLEIYQSGTDAVIQLPGGVGGVVVAGTTVAQLDGQPVLRLTGLRSRLRPGEHRRDTEGVSRPLWPEPELAESSRTQGG